MMCTMDFFTIENGTKVKEGKRNEKIFNGIIFSMCSTGYNVGQCKS